MDKMVERVPSEEDVVLALDDDVVVEDEVPTVFCTACEEIAAHTCHRCEMALCKRHSYHEENGTLQYCRACADAIVGVCDICDALHARPCRECGCKVCETHSRRVIERWGWGGAPGQGGFMSWFPMIRTYCQQHGSHRISLPKPKMRAFKGYDGSSPEW